MRVEQRIKRNISFKLIAELLARSLSFLFFLLLTHFLGDKAYGQYAFLMAFAGLFTVFADCGINTLLIKDIAREHQLYSKYIPHVFFIKSFLSLITWLLIYATLLFKGETQQVLDLIGWAAVIAISMAWLETFFSFFTAIERMENEVILKLIQRANIILIGGLVLFQSRDILSVLQGISAAYLLTILIGLILLLKNTTLKWEIDFDFIKAIFKESLPFWASGFFVMVYFKIDIIMLAFLGRPDQEVGWYNATVKMIDIIRLLPNLVALALYPILSDLFQRDKEQLKGMMLQSLKFMFLLGLPIAIGGGIIAEQFIASILSAEFLPAAIVFQILLQACPFIFMNYINTYILAATNLQNKLMLVMGVAFVFNIFFNTLLIPTYGYLGAGIATVMTEVLIWILCISLLKMFFTALHLPEGLFWCLITNVLLGIITYSLVYLNFPWPLVVLLIASLYMVCIYFLPILTPEEINSIKKFRSS